MGRPVSDNPATEVIRMRATKADKEEIRRRAAAAGLTMTEYLLRRALSGDENGS